MLMSEKIKPLYEILQLIYVNFILVIFIRFIFYNSILFV